MTLNYVARVIPNLRGQVVADKLDPKLPQIIAEDMQRILDRDYMGQCDIWLKKLGYIPYSHQIYYSFFLEE